MCPDGSYEQCVPGDDPVVDTQEILMARAREEAPERNDSGPPMGRENGASVDRPDVRPFSDSSIDARIFAAADSDGDGGEDRGSGGRNPDDVSGEGEPSDDEE